MKNIVISEVKKLYEENITNFLYFYFLLQSYFYKKESLLSGLIFNKDNITIRSEYETVLRFYGYDLDTTSMLTESKMNESAQMTNATEKEATDSIMTTLSPMIETEVQQTSTITSTTTKTTTTSTTSSTTTSEAPDIAETTIVPETTDIPDTTNVEETSEQQEAETDVPNEETTEENDNDDDDEDEESVTTTTTEAPPSRKRAVRGRLGRGLKNRRDKKQTSSLTIKSSGQSRKSRSYYVLLDDENIEYENGFNLETSSHASLLGPLPTHPPLSTATATAQASGKYLNKNQKDLFENINTDMVEHIFYLNEYETVRVPYKIYDTIMKYAHVGSLQASVIEIDLDTDYYNLIIFVPDYQSGLSDLINKLRLHDSNTLRYIRNQMGAVWVKTIVPKFNLKGNTILTSDLQNVSHEKFISLIRLINWFLFLLTNFLFLIFYYTKLEIVDIFEPSKADFSNMANDKTLYVKNVEQTININIRTQTTQQLKSNFNYVLFCFPYLYNYY